ncbi:unnamed protein product [Chilo suppressalis]|uniref:Serpin domain-containing protein n=1 Tax=Chilo suppressalis TaxID=168631 RepID=A0ABN8LC11_CHISP|nr:unnamed protein product [Chilo suppressalis]
MSPSARYRSLVRGLATRFCVLYALLEYSTATEDHGIPIEIKLWDSGRSPLSQMVDITNEFGLKVLAEHNFLNDNNIAFSPYGLMGILVALYEGVDGESSFQIQRGMRLPWNRNIMRIGFRDIHRTLKTYFVPEEGFLAGLALNNENVTFNDNYKKVLRFYGFDLENDQLPTLSPENATMTTNSTMSPDVLGQTTTPSMATESKAGENEATTTAMREETTANPDSETLNEVDIRGPLPPTTTASTVPAANAESIPPETTNPSTSTTSQIPTTNRPTPTTVQPTETITTTTQIPSSTTDISSPAKSDLPSTVPVTVDEVTSPTSTIALPTEPTIDNEVMTSTDLRTSTVSDATNNDMSTITSMSSDPSEPTTTQSTVIEQSMISTESTTSTSMMDIITTASVNASSLETLERKKKSIVDFIFTNPPYMDDYLIYRSYDVGLELPLPNFNNKMFLANGLKSVQVTYMHYDTVLEHAYLPHLEAAALRLPLDSERYYLLVVLPSRAGAAELGRLLSRMARESDLSDVYSALRPRRVRAVVPSFTVKGHVTLTTDLQKLGIRDVFEPRQADFTPMTRQPGVYVRSIEQAVSVAIRKYRPDDIKKNRYVTNRQPVSFTATYPFLYFVMDASIHVALMAGKMVDPLNTRIL